MFGRVLRPKQWHDYRNDPCDEWLVERDGAYWHFIKKRIGHIMFFAPELMYKSKRIDYDI